jgi:hypothetical protein
MKRKIKERMWWLLWPPKKRKFGRIERGLPRGMEMSWFSSCREEEKIGLLTKKTTSLRLRLLVYD